MNEDNLKTSLFSPRQKQFLAFVCCFAGGLVLVCLIAGVIYFLNQLFSIFSGVIWSLALSGMLAILLRPIVSFLESKLRLGRFFSILALYALVVLTSGLVIWSVGGKVIQQAQDFIGTAAEWPDRLEEKGKKHFPETWKTVSVQFYAFKEYWKEILITEEFKDLDLNETQLQVYLSLTPQQKVTFQSLDEFEKTEFFELNNEGERADFLSGKEVEMRNRTMESMNQNSGQLAEKSAQVLQSAWAGLLSLFAKITYFAVIPIYLFYFLSSNRNVIEDLEAELSFLSDSLRADLVFLIREFVQILVAFFRGQLLIGLLMGIGYAIGFTISGLKFGIALGLLFGLLNIIPYLGSIVGIIVTLLVAYLQPDGIAEMGQWNILLGCGISFLVVQLFESYFLTPKIMGQQTGLHPVAVIVSIFFWGTALGGILGMILGIPLTAFGIVAWRLICRKYLAQSFC